MKHIKIYQEYIISPNNINEKKLYHGRKTLHDNVIVLFDEVGNDKEYLLYGWGLYLTDSIDVATYYSTGKHRNNNDDKIKGHVYKIDVDKNANFTHWYKPVPKWLKDNVIKSGILQPKFNIEAEEPYDIQIKGDYITNKNIFHGLNYLYSYLNIIYDDIKEPSKFLFEMGLDGIIVNDSGTDDFDGKTYVILNKNILKII